MLQNRHFFVIFAQIFVLNQFEMKLLLFNPEHEIALAMAGKIQTLPQLVRKFVEDLSFLPVFWAQQGDAVLVHDVDVAVRQAAQLGIDSQKVEWLTERDLGRNEVAQAVSGIEVWGWNAAVCRRLGKINRLLSGMLPSRSALERVRQLSHRRQSMQLLEMLREADVVDKGARVGDSAFCQTLQQVENTIGKWGSVVLKAPWSSSGRGVRRVDGRLSDAQAEWCKGILHRQGGMMVEPWYDRMMDFGMEFRMVNERVEYLGLSCFATAQTAYSGNWIASEVEKQDFLTHYVAGDLLQQIRQQIMSWMPLFYAGYEGLFGVDMMIVHSDEAQKYVLHPCVEVNLRRTMGHVALDAWRFKHLQGHLFTICRNTDGFYVHVTSENPLSDLPYRKK